MIEKAKTSRKKCTVCKKAIARSLFYARFYSRVNICDDCLEKLCRDIRKKNQEVALDKLWEAIFQLQVAQDRIRNRR